MTQIAIVGYESDCNCDHCGRALRHGVRLNDGRVVGATCLDKKLTKPRQYQGNSFRFGAEHIVRIAKNRSVLFTIQLVALWCFGI